VADRHEDAYATLGVGLDADDETIAAAYRALARRHHPDLAGEGQTARMSEINAAFERIRTEASRIAYDQELDASDRAAGRPAMRMARRRLRTASNGRATAGTSAPSWSGAERDGTGGAGAPPGRPSGSVLPFGRHIGWSIGEIARVDPGYLVWLEERREGRPYLAEIDQTLRRVGYRSDGPLQQTSSGKAR
jgi:curved DNA-binding protein CbpA